jgi:hypothetical protein
MLVAALGFLMARWIQKVVCSRMHDMSGEVAPLITSAANSIPTDTTLRAESILLKAFQYASESANQSYVARDNTTNLFLLLVGALATGLGAIFQFGSDFRSLLLPTAASVLFAASILSVSLFVRYLSSRFTYIESLISANLIVEYYLHHLEPVMPDLGDAFRWRLSNIPVLRLVGPIMLYPMALCGSLCFSASLFISSSLLLPASSRWVTPLFNLPLVPIGIALAGLVLTLLGQIAFYLIVLRWQRLTLATFSVNPKN